MDARCLGVAAARSGSAALGDGGASSGGALANLGETWCVGGGHGAVVAKAADVL